MVDVLKNLLFCLIVERNILQAKCLVSFHFCQTSYLYKYYKIFLHVFQRFYVHSQYYNSNIRCYHALHRCYALLYNLPALIVLSLLIPTAWILHATIGIYLLLLDSISFVPSLFLSHCLVSRQMMITQQTQLAFLRN